MTTNAPARQPNAQREDWCIDQDTRDRIVARRNVLAGLWAAQLMRLPEQAAKDYAADVHFADYRAAGDDDIIRKLCDDLAQAGFAATPQMIRGKLAEFHRQAAAQSASTD